MGGHRVAKDSARIAAFGTFDEVGAHLGLVLATLPPSDAGVRALLERLQHELFIAQSELATPASAPPLEHRIGPRHVQRLEKEIDEYSATFEPVHTFVLARGDLSGAALHVARTVSRRAERELWTLHRSEPQRDELLQWTNRLSDLLFALALSVNRAHRVSEVAPDYRT